MIHAPRARLRVTTIVAILCMSACDASDRDAAGMPGMAGVTNAVQVSELEPGAPTESHTLLPYEEDEWSVYAGGALYGWLNCAGCHANGGGAIGPSFIDDEWIYGSDPVNIFATIWDGRPNGMPSYAGRISHSEVWDLVAYVRSLARLTRQDTWIPLADHMRGPLMASALHTGTSTGAPGRLAPDSVPRPLPAPDTMTPTRYTGPDTISAHGWRRVAPDTISFPTQRPEPDTTAARRAPPDTISQLPDLDPTR